MTRSGQLSSFHIAHHKIQLWLLSQAYQSHVLKGFSVSALSGMRIIHTEVLARLLALVPLYLELVGQLWQQCLSCCSVCPYPVLIPLCGVLHRVVCRISPLLKGRIIPGADTTQQYF